MPSVAYQRPQGEERVRGGAATATGADSRLDGDLRGTAVDDVGVGEDVDAGGLAGGEGAFEGGADVFWARDELAMPTKRLYHAVVADAGGEVGGGAVAEDRLLRVLDLRPL